MSTSRSPRRPRDAYRLGYALRRSHARHEHEVVLRPLAERDARHVQPVVDDGQVRLAQQFRLLAAHAHGAHVGHLPPVVLVQVTLDVVVRQQRRRCRERREILREHGPVRVDDVNLACAPVRPRTRCASPVPSRCTASRPGWSSVARSVTARSDAAVEESPEAWSRTSCPRRTSSSVRWETINSVPPCVGGGTGMYTLVIWAIRTGRRYAGRYAICSVGRSNPCGCRPTA